jgi:menaquinone-dependent protoporphyrinogen oxidase
MKVLVSAASRHGSTTELAETIAQTLRDHGVEAIVRDPSDVGSIDEFDAVVLGSAVYAGRWLPPIKSLIDREAVRIRARPVWLFSSGPLGDPPKPIEEPADVAILLNVTGARDHRVFAGRMDRASLGLAERAILAVVRAPAGDFRPWPEVTAWATEIAATLRLMDPVAVG